MMHLLLHFITQPAPTIPDIGPAEAPPGADKMLLPFRWLFWLVTLCCVGGFLVIGGKLAIDHKHGDSSQHAKNLGMAMAGAILIGSASGIAGLLV